MGQTFAFSSHPYKRLKTKSQTDLGWAASGGGGEVRLNSAVFGPLWFRLAPTFHFF